LIINVFNQPLQPNSKTKDNKEDNYDKGAKNKQTTL